MAGKSFRGEVTNSVVELNLLDGDAGTLSYGIGGANNGEIKVVHKGDITQSSGFYADVTVKGLVIGTSCTQIRQSAFENCTGLTGSLVIPDSVTQIGSYAFLDCTGLTGSLVIPDSVTSIENFTFNDCTGFNGDLVIPDSVTSIGFYTFYNCSSLTALYTDTPAASWNAIGALGSTTALVNIYTGPNATGYDATWKSNQGTSATVSTWTNYPNIP